MKRLLIITALVVVAAYTVWAATVAGYSATSLRLLASGARVTKIIISNTNLTTDATVAFFDTYNTTPVFTNAAYSSVVASTVTVTNIYTNYFGVVNTNIYTAVRWTTNTVAAATNNLPPVFTLVAKSNSLTTINTDYQFNLGVLVTNNVGVGVTLTY